MSSSTRVYIRACDFRQNWARRGASGATRRGSPCYNCSSMPETRVAPNQTLMPVTAKRDHAGRLSIGGCDLGELASAHGTPLWVLDEATVRAACRAYTEALAAHYPP